MAEDEKEEVEGELRKQYPSNARLSKDRELANRQNNDLPRKMEKVVVGSVLIKKKSLRDRFAENFFGDDTKSVGQYILYDILVPAAKNTITDMISQGIEMLVYGEPRTDRLRRDKGRSIVSYSSYSNERDRGRLRDRDRDRDRQESSRNRARQRFDDIIIDTRAEAEEVLSTLLENIDQYGIASVADFYDLVGLNAEHVDYKYGWDNLARAEVIRVREGFTFVFPKPIVID